MWFFICYFLYPFSLCQQTVSQIQANVFQNMSCIVKKRGEKERGDLFFLNLNKIKDTPVKAPGTPNNTTRLFPNISSVVAALGIPQVSTPLH